MLRNRVRNERTTNIVLDEFRSAVRDLVLCYTGTEPVVTESATTVDESELTALVGLAGENFSGSVAISTTLAEAAELAATTPDNLKDWVGELANQLAGRFKNKLGGYGLQPGLSPPSIIMGERVRIRSLSAERYSAAVSTDRIRLFVQLAFVVPAEVVLETREESLVMAEGSVELF